MELLTVSLKLAKEAVTEVTKEALKAAEKLSECGKVGTEIASEHIDLGKAGTELANEHISLGKVDTTQLSMEKLGETAPIENINDWLGEINPNYDAFDVTSPYCNNCGSCAYAVYQRLEGNPYICATKDNIPFNHQMEALTGMKQVSMSPKEIEARLLAEGNGAHAIIGIDRANGPGHWFNAACIDGKVFAIDGQSGELLDWPPDYGDVVNWEMSVKKGVLM